MKEIIKIILRPYGKGRFITGLDRKAEILDVGCGNNSPYKTKSLLPKCHYTGIDIELHKHTKPLLCDVYVSSSPDDFATDIEQLNTLFDAIISSHNLEHCIERERTLIAMLDKVKLRGKIFMSFPTETSVDFPSRNGTLNYFDDETHQYRPPDFEKILQILSEKGFSVIYRCRNYSPTLLYFIGMLLEPISKFLGKKMTGTWEYYGFESIIIAEKLDTNEKNREELQKWMS